MILFTLLLIPVSSAHAQADEWTTETHCAELVAPEAWSFAGTILLTGYGGVHGVNQAWATPHVLISTRAWEGQLSPDNRWYGLLNTQVIPAESFNHLSVIDAIQIYSTMGDGVIHTIPVHNEWLTNWGYREMFWIDNEHILYEDSEYQNHKVDWQYVVDIFDQSRTPWIAGMDILDGGSGHVPEYVQFPSPDFTRTVRIPNLYNVATGDSLLTLQVPRDALVAWMPDSSAFAVEISGDSDQNQLAFIDRDGISVEPFFDLGSSSIHYPQNIHWSPDGQFLAFTLYHNTLHLVDTVNHRIIDTCLESGNGFAWSPDGTQIAFLEPGRGTQEVYVFDLVSWSYRSVARHIVENDSWDQVIGWRID